MKQKRFDKAKAMKEMSRIIFDNIKPTKVLKATKRKLIEEEVKKEIDRFIKGEINE